VATSTTQHGSNGTAHVEARAPSCPGCGATLPIELGDDAVRCRHCAKVVPIDAALRGAMLDYVGDVAASAKKEIFARFHAAFYRQNEKAANSIVFGAIGFATFLTFAFVGWAITRQVPMGIPNLYFGILLGGWGLSLAAFARGWAIMYALPSLEALAAIGIVQCGGCGAMRDFKAGEATGDCAFCKSRLVVPFALAASLLASSRADEKRASVERGRSLEKAALAGDRLVGLAVFLVFAVVVVAVVVVLAIGRPAGGEVARGAMWLSFLGAFAIAFAFMWRSTARGMRKRAEVDAMVEVLVERVTEAAARSRRP
jgi:hypothetical protein